MSILFLLIPLGLVLLGLCIAAFFWATRSGQFDDLESHGWSVVLDDDQKPPPLDDEENAEKRGESGEKEGQ